MTDPEYFFDDSNPGDYAGFGIGYIITPPRGAGGGGQGRVRGAYCLWALPDPGYIHVYDTPGCSRAPGDVGSQSLALLGSPLLYEERDLTVAFNGQAAAAPTATGAKALQGTPGARGGEHADLANGAARAVVHTTAGPPSCSAPYDPGW